MTTPSSPQTLFTVSDILALISTVATVIGIIIALLQWGFTPASIIISVIGVTVLIYLLIERILPWFKNHFPSSPKPATEEISTTVIDELPAANSPLLPSDQTFLNQAIDKLDTSSALMLLAQEHRIQPPVIEVIYQQLQHRFGADNIYHLIPPGHDQATEAQYFSRLGQQLGWQRPCKDAIELENILAGKLPPDPGRHLYLFLSRLEKGNPERAKELAISLRGQVESGKLKVLLLGGGKLEELKFKADTTSLLNIADIERWPELTLEDVQQLYEQLPHHSPLTAKDRQDDLEASGGHPELLRSCLKYRANTPAGSVIDYLSQLQQETVLVGAFARFRRTPEHLKQLCEWLSQAEVGPAQPYIFDDLLREVYWLNLLVARGGRLVWRGEAVRQAGLQTLGCPSRTA